MFAQLLCRRDLLNDTLTRRFRIALPWLVLSLILLLQAITPAVAISQAPPTTKAAWQYLLRGDDWSRCPFNCGIIEQSF